MGRDGVVVGGGVCVSVSVSELEADRIVPVDLNRMGVPVDCDARDGIGKERLQTHNQACFSMHRKPGSQRTRCPASSVLGTDKWSVEGVVERSGTGTIEADADARRLPGISNEALGVWFRFREMMGQVDSVQGCGWCVRAQAAQLVVLPSPCVRRLRECVRAEGQGHTSQVWSGLPGWPGCSLVGC